MTPTKQREGIPTPKHISKYKERIWPKDLDLDPDVPPSPQIQRGSWANRIKFHDPPYEIELDGKIIDDIDTLKAFIAQTLSEERKALVEEVQGMRWDKIGRFTGTFGTIIRAATPQEVVGYNQALNDIILTLQKKEVGE